MISVPPEIADLVGEVPGADLVTWDMQAPAPREDIEVMVVPPWNSPRVRELAEHPKLRGVVLSSAGYDHMVRFLPPGVTLSNAVGVHDTATAELALALALAAQRDLPTFVRAQADRTWLPQAVNRSLADARVLLLGYGGVGRAITRRMLACEAPVTAVASRARAGDDLVDAVHGIDELDTLLPEADVLVLALPLSDRTRGLLDGRRLGLLPDDALVLNVGRGPLVDTDALVAECSAGRLRAALDVTDPEPLPEDHPLWSLPNVLISPHRGGASTAFPARHAAYVRGLIERYVETGRLDNVVAVGPGAGDGQ